MWLALSVGALTGSMLLGALPAPSTAAVQVRDGQIVYMDNSTGPGQLFTRNLDGSDVRQLTFPPGGAAEPAFSPDGQTIAYDHGGDGSGIWLMSSDGSDQRPLAADQATWSFEGPSWSLDGSRIAYARMAQGEGGGTDIWVMEADGSHQRNVTNDQLFNFQPAYSPDGVHVAFSGQDQSGSEPTGGIYDVDITTGEERQLTQNVDNGQTNPPSNFSDEYPDYSPDGHQIAFSRCGWWIPLPSPGPQCVISTMDSDGSHQQAITPLKVDGTVFDATDPAWSADGTQLTFYAYLGSAFTPPPSPQRQGPFLYVVNADGSGLTQLPHSTGAQSPVWQSVYSKRDRGCHGTGRLIAGASGPNLLRGSASSDVVDAGSGADKVIGKSGADTLCGGPGADRLVGGPGADKLVGGPGKDILIGGPGKDRIVSGGGDVVRP
jgi:Tol biopolymer transport system component